MSTPPPQGPKRRVRSESQMNHKRLADRLGHKERRKEQKQQIGKTEDDIADIKASLQALTLQLQSLPSVPAAPTPAARQDMSLGYAGSGSSMTTLSRESTLAPLPGWPFTSSPQSHGLGISMTPSTPIAAPSADMWSFLSRSDSTKILNCRCGLQHPDRFDCLESCDVTNVYRQHTVFPQSPNPARALPRNPSLPAMMLHSMDENPATFLITGFLRQFGHRSLEQLLGFYLMGYRYMRWMMQPTEETKRDAPVWLLPTEIQNQHPHSVCVDYLPWPSLRDYLCLSGDTDPRHSIHFYFESVVLKWPPGRPIMGQDDTGQVTLSSDFESVVTTLENWSMGPPWSDAFPHLIHLVHA